ncbi:peptide-methionine (S)-S-oxide reductase MsrA [Candidatus Saccharibacteria bacterium]|nr:peptide-methionine (S)-S-oxide reductase MsrA [Candidatus Saccharibacteria bacterium]
MARVREVIKEEVPPGSERAVFAGGCFWCLEANFQALPGVRGAINGYSGGEEVNPSYKEICDQQTGHREAVLVYYDPEKVGYEALLDVFWQSIDPTDSDGQFFDRGFSYTTAIFYLNEEQKRLAEASKQAVQTNFDRPVATAILPYVSFYEAEEYHQEFYQKSPRRYKDYSHASGREEYKRLVWEAILKQRADKKKGSV